MRRLLLLALVLFAAAARADDVADADRLLKHCLEVANGEEAGVEDLEKSCPGIWRAIDTLGYARYITDDQYESMDAAALSDLVEMRERYEGDHSTQQSPDPAALAPILEGLREPIPEQPPSMWQKFWTWLKGLFKSKDDQKDKESWLDRWLKTRHISERTSKIISYVVAGLVVLIAVAVVVNEVRLAMAGRRRRKNAGDESAALDELGPRSARALLDSAALSDQPTLLLRLLVARLVESGRLKRDRSLTHRELSQRARFDAPADGEVFQRIARLSERAIYGGNTLDAAEAEPILAQGRRLHDALLRPRLSGNEAGAAS